MFRVILEGSRSGVAGDDALYEASREVKDVDVGRRICTVIGVADSLAGHGEEFGYGEMLGCIDRHSHAYHIGGIPMLHDLSLSAG
jgi:hypothetical protein